MTTPPQQQTPFRPRAAGLVMSLALWTCVAVGDSFTTPDATSPAMEWPAEALAALSCVALLASRRRPRAALVVTAAATVTTIALDYVVTPLLLAPLMAGLFRLAAGTDSRTTHTYGFTTVGAMVATMVINDPSDFEVAGPLLWLLLPLAWGRGARLRGAYLQAVQARAEHAERTREEEAHHRVTEERMRIARDLHDVVAHHLALAKIQAGVAEHFTRTRPEQAQKILADLVGTTTTAMRELKATVGLLRHADDPDSAPLEPAPGLHLLPELIESCESGGLTVTVTSQGQTQPLSPGVDLTAYRIVQEALTNVAKHTPAKTAHIQLAYARTSLTLTITNDTDALTTTTLQSAKGGGFGLISMTERAHSVGGELRAGPRPAGGFQVTTALPLHPHDPRERTP
ncbi:sensor histidine kinase [Streptomyces sp. S3(2020)]|uniref:sensor histidine kinase n=1 Tax=Streptomyces sp. S3(2020) TaxID=2732044 RepID=UPI001488A470|nr:sensor histidine kinase [Streptomyces sp. S3(2020)]NNN29147.1 sensor histidine kinase [Streptomyces sp. S3(2020)]